MNENVNVFLPMRAGSERVPKKNTKTFAGVNGGLCKIKLEQLVKCDAVKNVIVSTNDPEVIDISNGLNSKKIKIIIRPDQLASSLASTDDLIRYVPEIMPDGHILWTHVTSPFIGPDIYNQIIDQYFKSLTTFDSLMTVSKLQKFIWNDSEPISYDRDVEKWPRTQTIDPLWEVNSGAFMASKAIYKRNIDRIGKKPFLFEISDEIAFDIDWFSDFKMAEAMYYPIHLEISPSRAKLDQKVMGRKISIPKTKLDSQIVKQKTVENVRNTEIKRNTLIQSTKSLPSERASH